MTTKFRSRCFNLVLYPDNWQHFDTHDFILQDFDSACILHDKDLDEEGKIKKPHWHIVIRCKNAVWNTALAKDLGVEDNYIQKCRSLKSSLKYLIHFDNPDKYQYSIDSVEGSLKKKLVRFIQDDEKDETEKVIDLMSFIDGSGYLSVCDLASWAAQNGQWDAFRRSATIFMRILDEHNESFRRMSL